MGDRVGGAYRFWNCGVNGDGKEFLVFHLLDPGLEVGLVLIGHGRPLFLTLAAFQALQREVQLPGSCVARAGHTARRRRSLVERRWGRGRVRGDSPARKHAQSVPTTPRLALIDNRKLEK